MNSYQVGPLTGWEWLDTDKAYLFESKEQRRVRFTLNTDGPVNVYAEQPDGNDEKGVRRTLLASDIGQFEVNYTAFGDSYVVVKGEEGVQVMIKGFAHDMKQFNDPNKPVHTAVAPKQRNNTEFDRMMMLMQHNQQVMQSQVDAMTKALAEKQAPKPSKQLEAEPGKQQTEPKPKAAPEAQAQSQEEAMEQAEPKAEKPEFQSQRTQTANED